VSRRIVPRRAFALVVSSCLTAVATITACAKGQEHPDTLAGAKSLATPVTAGKPRVIQQNLPGALPKPIDSLSGDELYALTRKLSYGGGVEKDRRCKHHPDCESSKPMMTKLRVDAVDNQDSVSVYGLPDNGVIAVKALNKGPYVDEMYGMKPGSNLEYFLVMLPGTSLVGRWRLEELDTTPGKRQHSQVSAGSLQPCMHAYVKKRVNRANFLTCADAHPMTDSVSTSGLALQGINPPIWVDCAQGCCIATSP
jgi:hypothetical protein